MLRNTLNTNVVIELHSAMLAVRQPRRHEGARSLVDLRVLLCCPWFSSDVLWFRGSSRPLYLVFLMLSRSLEHLA